MSEPSENLSLPVGVTGLDYDSAGNIHEEWQSELKGSRWRTVVKRMRDSDPIIGGVLFAIEMLVRQVDWSIIDASDDPLDSEAGAFIREVFGNLRPAWNLTLPEVLSFLPWGWVVLEMLYDRDARGRTVWRSWDIRGQDTLDGWEFDVEGHAIAMRQLAPPDYRMRTVPLNKALHILTSSRKRNPEGRSLLRNVYRPWYFKSRIENIEGIGIERDLAGLPVAYVPPEVLAPTRTAANEAMYHAISKIVTNIRRDEQEGVIWPLAYDNQGREVYKLTLLSTGGERQFNTSEIIARYESRMAMSLLADFILLGHDKVGAFALSSDKTELFAVALGAFLDTISASVEEQAFTRLLELNGMTGRAPRLMHSDIETADLGVLGSYLKALFDSGLLQSSPELAAHLLKQANLPVVTNEDA